MDLEQFKPGMPVTLAPGVRRVVAPNASAMTGPGTNTYLLGDPVWAVVDPGPLDAAHAARLAELAPAPRCVFVTHTHGDHSPLATPLAARTGAELIGRPPPQDGRQDLSFKPQRVPQRDELFGPAGQRLRAIDTPGHASNHVCYLLEEAGILFSGDHILDGMTPVILAPDGDMQHYLEALRRLRGYPLRAIAPGHGRLLPEPVAVIDALIAHRLKREARVVAVLRSDGPLAIEPLRDLVYSDTPVALHVLALRTLEAHLIKLQREQVVTREGERWVAL